MAFEVLRNLLQASAQAHRQKKEARRPGMRNYMKKELHTPGGADPAYHALLQEASDKKAPFAEKTKSYYRFSRDYPGLVDAQGYRLNSAREEKAPSKLAIAAFAVALVLVFTGGFILTDAALGISNAPTEIPDFVTEATTQATLAPEATVAPLPEPEATAGIADPAPDATGAAW